MNLTLSFLSNQLSTPITSDPAIRAWGHTRYDLPAIFQKLGFQTGAEVGTFDGYYSQKICAANPHVKLHCIDTWEDRTALATARQRLASYNINFKPKSSTGAVKDFGPNSLDFVFLASNTDMRTLTDELFQWMRVLRPNGIIAGHNYSDKTGIRPAVLAFAAKYQIKPVLVLHRPKYIDTWLMVKDENLHIA